MTRAWLFCLLLFVGGCNDLSARCIRVTKDVNHDEFTVWCSKGVERVDFSSDHGHIEIICRCPALEGGAWPR